jgi:TP901 family phage tail tape measure protein
MTQFKLKGKDIPHVADLLAAGADKALGSVTDLGYGLSQAGTQSHQMGFSIEDTVGTLAQFAQSGLIGERGGTT